MKRIDSLLRRRIGLDATSIGAPLVHRAVRQRMRNLGLMTRGIADYKHILECSSAEWNELVDAVVVAETWFFRDSGPFTFLLGRVLEDWLPAHPGGTLRILSVPCASGEEPYSIVMALRDAGFPLQRLQIDAVDISLRALSQARRGIYRRNSFRGADLSFRDRYFLASKEGFILDPTIRGPVDFHHANVLSHEFWAGQKTYDFIFCRNLLIYLDALAQRKVIGHLRSLLSPAGNLFVGSAEPPIISDHGFISANGRMAFAFRADADAAAPARRQRWPRPRKTLRMRLAGNPNGEAPGRHLSATEAGPSPGPGAAPSLQIELETARRLADAGRLTEAAHICEACLRQCKHSAQAYYLLGLVREARGDDGAADFYRKALYLEPDHYESLMQMALLSQNNGDATRARVFQKRAQRVQARR